MDSSKHRGVGFAATTETTTKEGDLHFENPSR